MLQVQFCKREELTTEQLKPLPNWWQTINIKNFTVWQKMRLCVVMRGKQDKTFFTQYEVKHDTR